MTLSDRANILIVEDEPIFQEILTENLTEDGYGILCAATGADAWEAISATAEPFDVILLDRLLPDMDGIEILQRINASPVPHKPSVIVLTSLSLPSEVAEGLQAGAHYYLTKPVSGSSLRAIVAAAIDDRRSRIKLMDRVRQSTRALDHLRRAEFSFRQPDDAKDIALSLANAVPKPELVVLGLSELMLNAIEHGNLGITYAEKSTLLAERRLQDEIACRLNAPAYLDKQARLIYERFPDTIHYTIIDQGIGFDWEPFLELSPDRAFHPNGRGIAMAKLMSFDHIEYHGCGNEVTAVVQLQ